MKDEQGRPLEKIYVPRLVAGYNKDGKPMDIDEMRCVVAEALGKTLDEEGCRRKVGVGLMLPAPNRG
jgi:hypothetical protein